MILKSVKIENFRCIEDSTEFSIDPVTCLVGKNEAGKTALLQALYKLKPVIQEESNFDDLMEYPRRKYSEYKERRETNPDNVLTTIWELEDEDIIFIEEELGKKALKNKTLKITKGYDNINYWELELDEKRIVSHYIKSAELEAKEREDLKNSETIEELINKLSSIESPSANQNNLLNELKEDFPEEGSSNKAIETLERQLPTFLYFGEYQNMPGWIAINELRNKMDINKPKKSERIFLALLDLAQTDLNEIDSTGKSEELIAELEAVSTRLTKEIFNYWSQNKNLKVEFRFDHARPEDLPPFNEGYIFQTRIENTRHDVTVNFDEHSKGFVWFFSFLVWFSQVKKIYGENLIILLDDPALHLHARAQADLLRYIDKKLKPNHQVIYTTHSPFMVDAENLLSVRTVEDVVIKENIKGTKVGDKVLSTDKDTIFPLQGALGYDITQTLFVGKHTLLVEGPSDILYLKWFSNKLKKQERTFLDHQWTITPCGGVDKIVSFLALFSGAKLNIAIFTDFHEGTKNRVRELKQSELLKQGRVFSAEMFVDQNEADIEDLIGRPNFITLANKCYHLTGNRKLPAQKPSKAPIRVLKEVEDKFGIMPPKTPEFDHYEPALYLIENTVELTSELPDLNNALNRFEKLFEDLNKLLPDK